MRAINRVNPSGLGFKLTEVFGEPGKTAVKLGNKTLIVRVPINEMDVSWSAWVHHGAFIQNAFPTLNANEREFLLSGLTPGQFERACQEFER
jgi:hypothetical protein